MTDPYRGEVCAAWLDFLADQEPETLLLAMAAVSDHCKDNEVRQRTRDVYLVDLAYANDPHVRFTIPQTGVS